MLDALSATVWGLSFDGFDAVRIREQVAATIPLGSLMVLLSAYVTTGNGLTKRVAAKKVSDKETADRVIRLMKDAEIKVTASTGTDLTLPRLAVAFPGLVIFIRCRVPTEPRVLTSTPPHLQDICLNGWTNLPAIAEAKDFIRKFSIVLGKAETKPPAIFNEAECVAKSDAFGLLGQQNQARDPMGVAALSIPITAETKLFELAAKYGYGPKGEVKPFEEEKASKLV